MKITLIHTHQMKAKIAATAAATTANTVVTAVAITHGRPACPQSSETTNVTAFIVDHYHQSGLMSL